MTAMRATRARARAAVDAVAIPRPSALGAWLHRLPVPPCDVARLLGSWDAYAAFRRIVREIFPAAEAEILAANGATALERESERCSAFIRRVEAEYFPCYELEEYEQFACGVPFVRFGWGYEDFHNLDMPAGKLLLLALCEQPYPTGHDTRIPLLDAVSGALPAEQVARIPRQGLHPTQLHERLDGTRFAAAAEFADWLWSSTGTIFLDADDEVEIYDAEWSREVVLALAEEWRAAAPIMDRVKALEGWLEEDPPRHFAELLDAVLGTIPHHTRQASERPDNSNQRRDHGNEKTEQLLAVA
jgi:hypothetical protein